jgi:uncharacterized oligopeptide transporter (OPT) family protein
MGGLVSLIRSLPSIAAAFASGLRDLRGGHALATHGERTDRDLPMSVVVGGSLLLIVALWLAPPLGINLVGALLMLVFGFVFVTVSSRITGEIGSSSNPISGMTISALLLSCLIFVALGWTDDASRYGVVAVAAVVCVASSNGGTTSQDLKTGFLVGGTPWRQQVAITVGALTSALVVGWTLMFLNTAGTCYVENPAPGAVIERAPDEGNGDGATDTAPDGKSYEVRRLRHPHAGLLPGTYLTEADGRVRWTVDPGILGTATKEQGCHKTKLDAPKARLMALIVDGIMTRQLPWALVLLGAFIALMVELCGVAALPFAVGVYLPVSTTAALFVGGAVRWLAERNAPARAEGGEESSPGVLLSSGLIAGGSICGILLAVLAAKGWHEALAVGERLPGWWLDESGAFALAMFLGLAAVLYRVARPRSAA